LLLLPHILKHSHYNDCSLRKCGLE
jgi:hypothetical protein